MSKLFAPTFRAFAKPTAAPVLASLAPRARPVCRSFHSSTARFEPNPVGRPHLLPEFSLQDKVIVVSGGARGLGLVQAEALLEAGATGKFTEIFSLRIKKAKCASVLLL